MAARKTRLKGRNTSNSTGQQVKRGATKTQTRKNSTVTPTGRKNVGGLVQKQKANVNILKSKQKTSARKPQLKRTKKATGTNAGNKLKDNKWKDEYEFEETDDFIFGDPRSVLSGSYIASNSKRASTSRTFTNIQTKKGNLPNSQEGRQKKPQARGTKPVGNKKKTSTPLASEPANHESKLQNRNSRGQRCLRVSLPKLDFDMSVTPILPISTPQSPNSSGQKRAQKGSSVKSVSFNEDSKSFPLSQTPSLPVDKVNHQITRRRAVVELQPLKSSASVNFKEPAALALPTSALGQKRKSPESSNFTESGTPTKKRKTEKRTFLTSKQSEIPQKETMSAKRQNKTTKQAPTKQTKIPFVSLTQLRKSPRKRKPVTSTPVNPAEEEQLTGSGEPDKKRANSPDLGDSGLSLGDDFSASAEGNSTTTPSLPGFMEDEPMKSSFEVFSESPLSAPSSSSLQEVPSLSKSAAKIYKPGKTKRERGRYSSSRLEAWASAVNKSFQDAESFELVVE